MSRLVPALLLLVIPASGRAQSATRAFAFEHVTVIDVESGRLLPGQTVVVTGNRITSVGPSGAARVPQGARRVVATGKYLVPGFWDMHVHIDKPGDEPFAFTVNDFGVLFNGAV